MKEPTPQNINQTLARLRLLVLFGGGGCLLGAILLLSFVPVDERVLASGKVRAEADSYLYAPEDGVLGQIHAYEGETVKAGQPVLSLDDSSLRQELKQLEASILKARNELDAQKLNLERTLKLPLPREFWHMQEDLQIARERLRQSEIELNRYNELFQKGLISRQELERTQLSLELARAEETKAKDKLGILDLGLESSILDEARALIIGAQSSLFEFEVRREILMENIERGILRAPRDGVVTQLLKRRPGERITRGEDLAHLAHGPANRLDLFAGENQIHRVRSGQRVIMDALAFDAMRHGYIEGTVTRVPLEPERRIDAEGTSTAEYRIAARIDSSPVELVIGSSVQAKIVLQRIPVWKLLLPENLRGLEEPTRPVEPSPLPDGEVTAARTPES